MGTCRSWERGCFRVYLLFLFKVLFLYLMLLLDLCCAAKILYVLFLWLSWKLCASRVARLWPADKLVTLLTLIVVYCNACAIDHDSCYDWWLLKEPLMLDRMESKTLQAFAFFSAFLGSSTAWMFGKTPPCAMVTPPSNLLSSSSFRIANCR